MHPTTPGPHPSSAVENPAHPNKTARPRLRGLSYLRGQSTSSPSVTSTTSGISDRSRASGLVRSVSFVGESGLEQTHNPDNTNLPITSDIDRTPPHISLDGSTSASRPVPIPVNRDNLPVEMARTGARSAPNGTDEPSTLPSSSRPLSDSLPGNPSEQMATIRLIPHQDPRSNRPSLAFPATSRTLPHEDCVIRVGRYSERDTNPNPPPNTPSSAPIGFKSKVVSRRHCEFWCSRGQWYIKDMKSSSGTFLNHIRLSNPSVESKPFPVHDGDVVQLGIDFRGGEEMIFRCVKIRVEVNRGWQKTLNNYNVQTHKRLRDLGKTAPKKDSDSASTQTSECSICLMSIAPCQSLFVAPCSHVWHYKCIRPIVNDVKNYPQFMCPNCRAVTDLEADVEDPGDDSWEDGIVDEMSQDLASGTNGVLPTQDEQATGGVDEGLSHSASRRLSIHEHSGAASQLPVSVNGTYSSDTTSRLLSRRGGRRMSPPLASVLDPPGINHDQGQYLRPITPTQPLLDDEDLNESSMRTPTMTEQLAQDGPMTPTNNAGPFVFDGSAGRVVGRTEVDSVPQPDISSRET